MFAAKKKMEILFATQNPDKAKEIAAIMPGNIQIRNLQKDEIPEEIPEEQDTLQGNALQKARYVWGKLGKPCFADDTGLEVEALDGRPGVFSARYAGPQKNSQDNIQKLLWELRYSSNRKAHFRTVIAFVIGDNYYLFEGKAEGEILIQPTGTEGFGYDPVFLPKGESRSFAQMALAEKNTLSHRAKAFHKFAEYLDRHYTG